MHSRSATANIRTVNNRNELYRLIKMIIGAMLVEVTDSGFKTTTTSLQKVLDKHALKDRYTRVLVGETAQS